MKFYTTVVFLTFTALLVQTHSASLPTFMGENLGLLRLSRNPFNERRSLMRIKALNALAEVRRNDVKPSVNETVFRDNRPAASSSITSKGEDSLGFHMVINNSKIPRLENKITQPSKKLQDDSQREAKDTKPVAPISAALKNEDSLPSSSELPNSTIPRREKQTTQAIKEDQGGLQRVAKDTDPVAHHSPTLKGEDGTVSSPTDLASTTKTKTDKGTRQSRTKNQVDSQSRAREVDPLAPKPTALKKSRDSVDSNPVTSNVTTKNDEETTKPPKEDQDSSQGGARDTSMAVPSLSAPKGEDSPNSSPELSDSTTPNNEKDTTLRTQQNQDSSQGGARDVDTVAPSSTIPRAKDISDSSPAAFESAIPNNDEGTKQPSTEDQDGSQGEARDVDLVSPSSTTSKGEDISDSTPAAFESTIPNNDEGTKQPPTEDEDGLQGGAKDAGPLAPSSITPKGENNLDSNPATPNSTRSNNDQETIILPKENQDGSQSRVTDANPVEPSATTPKDKNSSDFSPTTSASTTPKNMVRLRLLATQNQDGSQRGSKDVHPLKSTTAKRLNSSDPIPVPSESTVPKNDKETAKLPKEDPATSSSITLKSEDNSDSSPAAFDSATPNIDEGVKQPSTKDQDGLQGGTRVVDPQIGARNTGPAAPSSITQKSEDSTNFSPAAFDSTVPNNDEGTKQPTREDPDGSQSEDRDADPKPSSSIRPTSEDSFNSSQATLDSATTKNADSPVSSPAKKNDEGTTQPPMNDQDDSPIGARATDPVLPSSTAAKRKFISDSSPVVADSRNDKGTKQSQTEEQDGSQSDNDPEVPSSTAATSEDSSDSSPGALESIARKNDKDAKQPHTEEQDGSQGGIRNDDPVASSSTTPTSEDSSDSSPAALDSTTVKAGDSSHSNPATPDSTISKNKEESTQVAEEENNQDSSEEQVGDVGPLAASSTTPKSPDSADSNTAVPNLITPKAKEETKQPLPRDEHHNGSQSEAIDAVLAAPGLKHQKIKRKPNSGLRKKNPQWFAKNN